jgi:hypothetical protein
MNVTLTPEDLMPVFYIKQPASRWIRDNNILLTGNQTSTPSANFSASTRQIRVCSNLSGFLQIDGSVERIGALGFVRRG